MWKNRKLASWVVSFSCLHFNRYAETVWWKVWLLQQKNKRSTQFAEKKNAGGFFCSKSITGPGSWHKRCSTETPWSSFGLFFFSHLKTRRAEVKALSPALCCCATHTHARTHTRVAFAVVSSANLLFSRSQHPARRGVTRGWRCSLTASLGVQKVMIKTKKKKE